ncbi:MAG: hypothetical protein AAF267_25450 [Deinococcota bacterium]
MIEVWYLLNFVLMLGAGLLAETYFRKHGDWQAGVMFALAALDGLYNFTLSRVPTDIVIYTTQAVWVSFCVVWNFRTITNIRLATRMMRRAGDKG